MKQLGVFVLWAACVGLSMLQMYATTTPATPSSDPCDNYYLLSQHERNIDYILTGEVTYTICDAFRFDDDAGEWYRFDNKVTGGRLPEFCVSTVSEYPCGTHVPIWMNGNHPTEAFPGPKTVKVCGNKYITDQDPDDCCGWSAQIQVKYCPAKSATAYPYYVYQLKNPPQCESAYCTTKACEPGYTRNMTDHCVDMDECLSDPCWSGMCINTEGSYTCISDGSETTTMPSFNSCHEMPCINGYCISYYYEPYCACNYGYTGVYCDTKLPCFDNPCGPGQCHEIDDGTFECTCPRGVYGHNCSDVDCDYEPCENGECVESYYPERQFCECYDGYEGVLCERSTYVTSTIQTTPQPCTCYYGGTCKYNYYYNDYYCDCPMGYTGEKCETALNCNSPGVTCQNGGSCLFIYGYSCHCPYGTSGDFCQYRIRYNYTTTTPSGQDPCRNAYCGYGSTCLPGRGSDDYTCLCGPDYTGHRCEVPIDCGCVHGDCINYDPDSREYFDYTCDCHPGYTGPTCDIQMTYCYQGPCHNSGVCRIHYTDIFCTCPDDFAGLYCEEENEKPGIDIEIDTDDASTIIQNGQDVPELVANIINLYCTSNLDECCNSFGFSRNPRVEDVIFVTADQSYMNYVEFDQSSFVIRIRAYTTTYMLSQFCLVTDNDNSQTQDDGGDSSEEDIDINNEYLSPDLLQSIVENSIDQIELATGVDILSVESSALSQDDDADDNAVTETGHSKALVIGLSVVLSILALLVIGSVILVVCMKCLKPKTNRQLAANPQPVAAVSRPEFMYQQPTTPHDLFLASGANGMPPPYQQVVKYPTSPPPSYNAHVQSPMYGGTPETKKTVLPPINPPVDGGAKKPEGGQLDTVTNPAPPSDTVYHFQAPRVPPVGRLPPIQHSNA